MSAAELRPTQSLDEYLCPRRRTISVAVPKTRVEIELRTRPFWEILQLAKLHRDFNFVSTAVGGSKAAIEIFRRSQLDSKIAIPSIPAPCTKANLLGYC
jgi:hypothetical protein